VPRFQTRLMDGLLDKTGRRTPLPAFQPLLDPAQDETFQKASQNQAGPHAAQVREQLGTFAGERYTPHLRKRRTLIVAEYASPDGGIRQLVHELLANAGPAALGLTYAVVAQVKQTLERQWFEINEAIEGNPHASTPIKGKKEDLEEKNARWDNAVRQLGNGFGSGPTRALKRNGKAAKERFFRTTWRPLREATLELELLMAARETYQSLVAETSKVERALGEMMDQIGSIRADLERSTRTDIGEHGKSGVLDLAVLDDPRLVAHRFDDLLNETVTQGADDCAIAVTRPEERWTRPPSCSTRSRPWKPWRSSRPHLYALAS
jgi:hypothetical protein